jgi:hypothetical protein
MTERTKIDEAGARLAILRDIEQLQGNEDVVGYTIGDVSASVGGGIYWEMVVRTTVGNTPRALATNSANKSHEDARRAIVSGQREWGSA